MKFLDEASLSHVNSLLDNVNIGNNCKLISRLEVYSCKRAGDDKRLAKSLEERLSHDAFYGSPETLGASPFGPLNQPNPRKTFINLVALLNASFPDYDFSSVTIDQFTKEEDLSAVQSTLDTTLNQVVPAYYGSVCEPLWASINEAIGLADAEVHTYIAPGAEDPFTEPGTLWAMNYFFTNRKLRRVLMFTVAVVNASIEYSPLSSSAGARDPLADLEDADDAMADEFDDEDDGDYANVEDDDGDDIDGVFGGMEAVVQPSYNGSLFAQSIAGISQQQQAYYGNASAF